MAQNREPDRERTPSAEPARSADGDATRLAPPSDPTRPTPLLDLTLWPHRSLSPKGFRAILWLVAVGAAIPLGAIVGSAAFWVILAFFVADMLLLYGMLRLTYRSGRLRETVRLWPDLLRIDRVEPNGRHKRFEANPYWVRVELLPTERIEDYLVLSASGRTVELGAFLTPPERRALAAELRAALARATSAAG